MAYCTSTEIQSEFRDITFSSSSAVTTADVTSFIDQASAFIDSLLSSQFIVPITGTESLKVIKNICVWLVADRVSNILRLQKGQDDKQPIQDSLYKRAMEMISMILDNKVFLNDAKPIGSASPQSSFSSNTTAKVIKKYERQW